MKQGCKSPNYTASWDELSTVPDRDIAPLGFEGNSKPLGGPSDGAGFKDRAHHSDQAC